jgi:hypothetical protein
MASSADKTPRLSETPYLSSPSSAATDHRDDEPLEPTADFLAAGHRFALDQDSVGGNGLAFGGALKNANHHYDGTTTTTFNGGDQLFGGSFAGHSLAGGHIASKSNDAGAFSTHVPPDWNYDLTFDPLGSSNPAGIAPLFTQPPPDPLSLGLGGSPNFGFGSEAAIAQTAELWGSVPLFGQQQQASSNAPFSGQQQQQQQQTSPVGAGRKARGRKRASSAARPARDSIHAGGDGDVVVPTAALAYHQENGRSAVFGPSSWAPPLHSPQQAAPFVPQQQQQHAPSTWSAGPAPSSGHQTTGNVIGLGLGPDQYAAAFDQGQHLNVQQAIAQARAQSREFSTAAAGPAPPPRAARPTIHIPPAPSSNPTSHSTPMSFHSKLSSPQSAPTDHSPALSPEKLARATLSPEAGAGDELSPSSSLARGAKAGTKRKVHPVAEDEDDDDDDNDLDEHERPVKKTAHNMIEKRYRNNLNDKIGALRDSVPSLRIMSKSARGEDTTEDREELHGLTPAHKLNKATVGGGGGGGGVCRANGWLTCWHRFSARPPSTSATSKSASRGCRRTTRLCKSAFKHLRSS